MSFRKVVPGLVVAGLVLAFAASAVWAQGAPTTGDNTGRRGNRGGFRGPDMKTVLQLSDDEWTALQPKFDKLQKLQGELMSVRMQGMGGRGPRGGTDTPAAAPEAPTTDIGIAAKALTDTLDNKDAAPKDIAAKLAAFRDAREKVKADIVKAQAELKEMLTPRQEARLVLMGRLD